MNWKTIGVLGKPHAAEQNLSTLQTLAELFSKWKIQAAFDEESAHALHIKGTPTETLVRNSELILVVGGDGSMLNAARLAVAHKKPLLGINRGHLGFLTDLGQEELPQRLKAILDGAYWEEERDLLQGTIGTQTHTALNDIVLSLGASSQLIEFDLWVDQSFVCRQRADGLIITTPTGSTAYALSAGGPILHPQLEAIAIVPMFPHKLTSRPLVINKSANIRIILKSDTARVSFDSQNRIDLEAEACIDIKTYPEKLRLIHPKEVDYFKTLRDKLYWESR